MKRYRAKPNMIRAFRFDGELSEAQDKALLAAGYEATVVAALSGPPYLVIGIGQLRRGATHDWIIYKGTWLVLDGDTLEECFDDAFHHTYEEEVS